MSTLVRFGKAQAQGGRPNMEDRLRVEYIESADLTVAVVADGIGGGPHGELAAQLTIDTIFEQLHKQTQGPVVQVLETAVKQANRAVQQAIRDNPRHKGMGSTATLAVIQGNRLHIANLGDSRAYLIRGDKVIQLTRDHTWGNYMIFEEGKPAALVVQDMRAGELVRSIGQVTDVQVDLGLYLNGNESENTAVFKQGLPLHPNDRIVLCSDGLVKSRHNDPSRHYVEDEEMWQTVMGHPPQKAADKLVQQALNRQVDDNVSVIVLETPGSEYLRLLPSLSPVWGGVGVIAVILLAIIFYFLFVAPDNTPPTPTAVMTILPETIALASPTTRPPSTATLPPVTRGMIDVIRFDASGRWQAGDENAMAITGEQIPVSQNLKLESRASLLEVRLPDETILVLDKETTILIEQVYGFEETNQTHIRVLSGQLVVIGGSVIIIGRAGETAESLSSNTLMGILTDPRFELHCLVGLCRLGNLQMAAGEAACLGQGCNQLFPARYDIFSSLTDRVPLPTATPTSSPTITPSPTPTYTRPPRPTDTPEATSIPATAVPPTIEPATENTPSPATNPPPVASATQPPPPTPSPPPSRDTPAPP